MSVEKYTNTQVRVGSGSFSEVFKGYNNATGEIVAIKKPRKKVGKEEIKKEIKAFKQLTPHENIISILDCKYLTLDYYFISLLIMFLHHMFQ